MTKQDLVKAIHLQTGMDKDVILSVVEHLMKTIKESLVNDKDVYLRGFGNFINKTKHQKNFHAAPGKYILIPEHQEPAFKPCKRFVQAVSKNLPCE